MYVLGHNETRTNDEYLHACISHMNGAFKNKDWYWPFECDATVGDKIFQNGKQLLMRL